MSQGNTGIMVMVDQFAKAFKFVAVPGLQSAKEAASLLLKHVVRTSQPPCYRSMVLEWGVVKALVGARYFWQYRVYINVLSSLLLLLLIIIIIVIIR